MARWVSASLHTVGAASSSGYLSLIGAVAGVCALVVVIGLCTLSSKDNRVGSKDSSDGDDDSSSRSSTKSSPKNWISLSSKKLLLSMKRERRSTEREEEVAAYDEELVDEQTYSPVWRRIIMMGERCEPPSYSGRIFYDEHGNRVEEFPAKSPRAAAIPPGLVLEY